MNFGSCFQMTLSRKWPIQKKKSGTKRARTIPVKINANEAEITSANFRFGSLRRISYQFEVDEFQRLTTGRSRPIESKQYPRFLKFARKQNIYIFFRIIRFLE